MNFIFDNNLPPALAQGIGALTKPDGHAVEHLRNRFAPNTPDVDWIEKLGSEGRWIILSGDLRIFRNRHEREVWRASGLTAFFLAKGWINHKFWEQAWRMMRWWPVIVEVAQLVQPGAAFEVPLQYGTKSKLKQLRT